MADLVPDVYAEPLYVFTHAQIVSLLLSLAVAAVTEWIDLHFANPKRPKCLVLIGPSGTGASTKKDAREKLS